MCLGECGRVPRSTTPRLALGRALSDTPRGETFESRAIQAAGNTSSSWFLSERQVGLKAYRVPLSGISAGFKSDVEVRIGSQRLRFESKVRAKEFGLLYRWLTGSDALVVKADRKPMLVVLPLEKFAIALGEYASAIENVAHKPLAQPSP